jgi:hypothetical protein
VATPGLENARTLRNDFWWGPPLLSATAISGFLIYTAWAGLQGTHYEYKNYLSPFYPPFEKPGWWPLSPAFLILWIPATFRLTCYYFRKTAYRSFFLAPPACAVKDAVRNYAGESRFPLIVMNLHRLFLYLAIVELGVLWTHTLHAFSFESGFGIGLGSVLFLANVVLLTFYVTSCHAFRHLVGGKLDCFSACPKRYRIWRGVSRLNENHGLWFWLSMFSVGLTDLYSRLLSMGIIHDLRIL